jgi:hypothetical protein
MSDPAPVVRHMLLCDDVRADPDSPEKINIHGHVTRIRSGDQPPFPLRHPSMCVYVVVSGGRGEGEFRIVVKEADPNEVVFASPGHRIAFPADPVAVVGIVFRILDCPFPRPGLYVVHLEFNRRSLAQEPLVVR